MAQTTKYILVGPATFWLSDYTTAGGAGTNEYEVGHTKGPTTLSVSFEDYEVKSEQAYGVLKKIPQSASVKVKVVMEEATLKNLRYALRQVSGNYSPGGSDTGTLLVGAPSEQYNQIRIIGKAPSAGTRTVTAWKCIVESVAEISFGKGTEQLFDVTFDVLFDDSLGTADKFLKVVDN